MESENEQVVYCAEDDEYKMYCDICDKICIERYYENHLKSGTHTNNFYKRQRKNITDTNSSNDSFSIK